MDKRRGTKNWRQLRREHHNIHPKNIPTSTNLQLRSRTIPHLQRSMGRKRKLNSTQNAAAEAQEAVAAVASTKSVIKPDAGLKTKVKLSTESIEIENGIIEVVPRNVVTDDGEIIEANEYSQTVNQITSIDVYKNNNLIASNLGSSSAVTTAVTNSVSSSSSSSNNGGSDDDDDDCCFPAGTLVTMADGSYKTIEDVEAGDFVLSYDIDLNEIVSCRVREIVSPVRKGVYSINNGLIHPTDDHPIYTLKPDGISG